MDKIKEITKGKAKSLYTTSKDDRLVMHFSDDTSAFDGKKKEALLGKGAVNNQFNAFIMDHLQNNGVETHHIEVLNNNDSLVWNLNMFPIECVIRNRASGSICRRLGTEDGLILESPLFEFFLKDDDLGDPLINDEHIISFGWATKDQIDEMKKLTYKVNSVLKELFINSGLILVDFKVEFGVNGNGQPEVDLFLKFEACNELYLSLFRSISSTSPSSHFRLQTARSRLDENGSHFSCH